MCYNKIVVVVRGADARDGLKFKRNTEKSSRGDFLVVQDSIDY